ncbi:MAG: redoxin domain-containing protein [Anaerolineales bacterium]|nr:redoxin domain-containing protein [Anaerolineales bacterium]
MRKWFLIPLLLLLAGCAGASATSPGDVAALPKATSQPILSSDPIQVEPAVNLPNLGPAPELQNDIWLNTPEPLRLASLRGKVVLLDMWTFGCYNCKNVIPSLREWHSTYKDQGLVVIGNHYPEFSYEEDLGNLKQAIIQLDIPYPVAQDNERLTWGAYNNRYWPTLYLIDKNGNLRYSHIGEGAYDETEAAIVALLNESYP